MNHLLWSKMIYCFIVRQIILYIISNICETYYSNICQTDHHQEREDEDEKAESRKVTLLQQLDNKMYDIVYMKWTTKYMKLYFWKGQQNLIFMCWKQCYPPVASRRNRRRKHKLENPLVARPPPQGSPVQPPEWEIVHILCNIGLM